MSSQAFAVNQPISLIEIATELAEIQIIKSENGTYGVDYKDEPFYETNYSVENGQIILNQKIKKAYFILHPGLSLKIEPIIVKIPAEFSGTLSVKTTNATISSAVSNNLKLASYKSTNNSIIVKNLKVNQSLNIQTSNSQIDCLTCSAEKSMQLITSNAAIIGENLKCDTLVATTRNSKINLDDCVINNSLEVRTSNAHININNTSAPNMTLTTSNSTVTMDGAIIKNLGIHTSNAQIVAELIGKALDYNFYGTTSSGDVTFGNVTSYKELRVPIKGEQKIVTETSNSNIIVRFKND